MPQLAFLSFFRNLRASPLARLFRAGARWTDDIIHVRYSTYTKVKKLDVVATTGDYYYEKNHLGSVIRITSNTGWIVDEYSYTVYGKAYRKNPNWLYKPVAGANDSPIWNTRLYTGREYDKEISLYYMRARYYDAGLGRFVSRDPIGMRDNVNLYTYVANSPVKYVDRMGLEKVLIVGFAWRDPWKYWELSESQYSDPWIWSLLTYFASNYKNTNVKWYNSSVTKLGSEKWDALDNIMDNQWKYDKLVLLWHSVGADNAVEISQILNEKGINVNLMVTIDLQSAWDTTTIYDNVEVAKNYYQTNWNASANGDILSLDKDINTTKLSNIDASSSCMVNKCPSDKFDYKYYHTDIDDKLGDNVLIRDIQSIIY